MLERVFMLGLRQAMKKLLTMEDTRLFIVEILLIKMKIGIDSISHILSKLEEMKEGIFMRHNRGNKMTHSIIFNLIQECQEVKVDN
jgi:hypothetical protein